MARLDREEYPTGPSNIPGSRGRPIKRQGLGLRDAMRGYDVPRRDRLKARSLDQRAGKQAEAAQSAAPLGPAPAPATGNLLNQRQNLFRRMEKAGAEGITPEMRAEARGLGVADDDFNAAASRIQTNQIYTPSWRQPVQPSAATQPSPTPVAGAGVPKVNRITGMQIGTLPGDAAYQPSWRTPNTVAAPPAKVAFGPDLAKENLAKKGVSGAIADYQQRSDAEKTTRAASKWRQATATPPGAVAGAPVPRLPSWKQQTASAAPVEPNKRRGFRI